MKSSNYMNHTSTHQSDSSTNHNLAVAIANRLNLNINSYDLLGLIGDYTDSNNYAAIISWLDFRTWKNDSNDGRLQHSQLVNRLACQLESDVQDVFYYQS